MPTHSHRPMVALDQPVAPRSLPRYAKPILFVITTPSFEGYHVRAIVVEASSAREYKPMYSYLYYCSL